MNARRQAQLALKRLDSGGYSNLLASELFGALDKRDRAFATTLLYGVIERRITLDYYISKLSSVGIKKLDREVLNALRLGIYQIMFLESVPDSAAVNESVKLVKNGRNPQLGGFVNAVLRSFLRKKGKIPLPTDRLLKKSVELSCPAELIAKLEREYGEKEADGFLRRSLEKPPIFVKTNTVRVSPTELVKRLADEGIAASVSRLDDEVLTVSGEGLFETKAFSDGLLHVEDISSVMAAKRLGAKKGESVLDLCAAPGGKSFTLAECMGNEGELISCDIHKSRVELIKDGARRLGLEIIKPALNDATIYNPALGIFDRVLCDMPCSGFGVISRKPEIKYKSLDDIKELPRINLGILDAAAKYVRRGGILQMCTCTLNRDENDCVAEQFLKRHAEFACEYIGTTLGEDGGDGFFTAGFKRAGEN